MGPKGQLTYDKVNDIKTDNNVIPTKADIWQRIENMTLVTKDDRVVK